MGAHKSLVPLLLAAWWLMSVATGPDPTAEFLAGYQAAGGPLDQESHIINAVIPCESGWSPTRTSSQGHLGLMQWDLGTWEAAGGGDWTDPRTQGRNTATWLRHLAATGQSPGSTAGWPGCWWSGTSFPDTGSKLPQK